jgi:hypothetical protein
MSIGPLVNGRLLFGTALRETDPEPVAGEASREERHTYQRRPIEQAQRPVPRMYADERGQVIAEEKRRRSQEDGQGRDECDRHRSKQLPPRFVRWALQNRPQSLAMDSTRIEARVRGGRPTG